MKKSTLIIICILAVGFMSGCSKTWNKTFGGTGEDEAYSVQETSDGGYILAGYTESFGASGRDAWLIKTDAEGSKVSVMSNTRVSPGSPVLRTGIG